jgi:hypothetical protein
MALAYSVDPIDLIVIAVVVLTYGLAFFILFAVSKFRQRKLQAAHRKLLEQLHGEPIDR